MPQVDVDNNHNNRNNNRNKNHSITCNQNTTSCHKFFVALVWQICKSLVWIKYLYIQRGKN